MKALSNQKLYEMRKRFGHTRCGLQTGDASLNTEAEIVIMTTEILRNIMYRTAEMDTGSGTSSTWLPGGKPALTFLIIQCSLKHLVQRFHYIL